MEFPVNCDHHVTVNFHATNSHAVASVVADYGVLVAFQLCGRHPGVEFHVLSHRFSLRLHVGAGFFPLPGVAKTKVGLV